MIKRMREALVKLMQSLDGAAWVSGVKVKGVVPNLQKLLGSKLVVVGRALIPTILKTKVWILCMMKLEFALQWYEYTY